MTDRFPSKFYKIQMMYHEGTDTVTFSDPLSEDETVISAKFLRKWANDENDSRSGEDTVLHSGDSFAFWNEDQGTWVIQYPTGDKTYIPQYLWGLASAYLDSMDILYAEPGLNNSLVYHW